MHEKDEFQSIESQLTDEAQGLMDTTPMRLIVADLRHKLSVRQENRRQSGALLAIAVVVGFGTITMNSFSRSSGLGTVSHTNGRTVSRSEQVVPSIDLSESDDATMVIDDMQGRRFVFVFSRETEDGQSESAVGIYVPEQVKDVDLEELTAAQRYGVSDVLGSEMSFNNDRSI